MGKARLEKYQAKRKAALDLDARLGRNRFGLARSTAARSNMKGSGAKSHGAFAVQRANVIGFTVNSKGSSVVTSRIYRTPSINGHPMSESLLDSNELQVSDMFMPREDVLPSVREARRALRLITPEYGRGGPSLFDACVLVDEGRHSHYRFTQEPSLVHERSGRHEGRSRHVFSAGDRLPMYRIGKVDYHWPSISSLPPYACVDTRAVEREQLRDAVSLFHMARTEQAAQISEHWPWAVDWAQGAPRID